MSTEKATEVPLLSVKATEKSTARTEAPASNQIADSTRLDWLQDHGHSLMYYGPEKWDVHAGMVRPTAREAIDAAIVFFADAEPLCPRCHLRPRKTIAWDKGDGLTLKGLAQWCDECLGTP